MMFQVYKRFFPNIAVGYEDPRVNVHICDGMRRHLICLILPTSKYITTFLCALFLPNMQELNSCSQFLKAPMMP